MNHIIFKTPFLIQDIVLIYIQKLLGDKATEIHTHLSQDAIKRIERNNHAQQRT